MAHDRNELINIVEAALFAAVEPVTVGRLIALFPAEAAPSRADVEDALTALESSCHGRGIELKRVGKGYRFQTREKYSQWLRKLFEGRPPRYSRAAMETLAIIAYRQPVTRGDIEEIRGVSVSGDTVRTLINRGWVKEVGHRDVAGRPALLGTTREFLEYFNLRSLSELPPLLEKRTPEEIAGQLDLTAGPVANSDEPQTAPGEAQASDGMGDDGEGSAPRTAQIIQLEPRTELPEAIDGETA